MPPECRIRCPHQETLRLPCLGELLGPVDTDEESYVRNVIPLVRVPCRFGGARPYAVCLG